MMMSGERVAFAAMRVSRRKPRVSRSSRASKARRRFAFPALFSIQFTRAYRSCFARHATGTAADADGKPLVSRARRRKLLFSRETPVFSFFWASFDTVQAVREKRKCQNQNSPKLQKPQKPKTDFKPHKAVVLARREISWEPTRHLHARVPGCEARVRTEGLASASLCPCARGPCEGATRERARSSPRPRNSRNPTGGGFPERKSWHSARRHDTLARDVLLSVHPRQARPSWDDLDRRAPGQKAEETANHGDGRRHRRSCVPHLLLFFSERHPRARRILLPRGRARPRGRSSPTPFPRRALTFTPLREIPSRQSPSSTPTPRSRSGSPASSCWAWCACTAAR